MSFTLINAGPSPFGRKVAIALIEKKLDYVIQYDLPWGDKTCTPNYSPLQQLPILIEENGNCVYDSTYILEWLERRFPQPALLPADVDKLLEAKLRQMQEAVSGALGSELSARVGYFTPDQFISHLEELGKADLASSVPTPKETTTTIDGPRLYWCCPPQTPRHLEH